MDCKQQLLYQVGECHAECNIPCHDPRFACAYIIIHPYMLMLAVPFYFCCLLCQECLGMLDQHHHTLAALWTTRNEELPWLRWNGRDSDHPDPIADPKLRVDYMHTLQKHFRGSPVSLKDKQPCQMCLLFCSIYRGLTRGLTKFCPRNLCSSMCLSFFSASSSSAIVQVLATDMFVFWCSLGQIALASEKVF